jgi:hypothetical protein
VDQPRRVVAAPDRLADGGHRLGVGPDQVARRAVGRARAVDHRPGHHRVQEPGQRAGAARGQVEADVGGVPPAQHGHLQLRIGEEAVGDTAADESIGAQQ